jgi:hypothetical protein
MKRLALLSAGLLLAASSAVAQDRGTTVRIQTPAKPVAKPQATQALQAQDTSLGTVTPEMWLYLQEQQRHDDPLAAVRRKAEERASHRQDRLAARRWFGLSNARPTASPVPVMGTYSPFWAGQNSDPNRWDGVGSPVIVVEEEHNYVR